MSRAWREFPLAGSAALAAVAAPTPFCAARPRAGAVSNQDHGVSTVSTAGSSRVSSCQQSGMAWQHRKMPTQHHERRWQHPARPMQH